MLESISIIISTPCIFVYSYPKYSNMLLKSTTALVLLHISYATDNMYITIYYLIFKYRLCAKAES